jgi:hypothetical protein
MNSRVFLNMNIYNLFSRYDDRRWPTLLAVSAVSLVLGCAAIHPRLSAAQPGSQKAGALHVGDDLPSNTNSAVVGRVVDVDGNPLAFVTVGLSPVANNNNGPRQG